MLSVSHIYAPSDLEPADLRTIAPYADNRGPEVMAHQQNVYNHGVALTNISTALTNEQAALGRLSATDPARTGIQNNINTLTADLTRIDGYQDSELQILKGMGVTFEAIQLWEQAQVSPELPTELAKEITTQQRATQLKASLEQLEQSLGALTNDYNALVAQLAAQQRVTNTATQALAAKKAQLLATRLNEVLGVLTSGAIPEHTGIAFAGGLTGKAHTGWERHGTTVKDGVLVSVGTIGGSAGTLVAPGASDHVVVIFDAFQANITQINLAGTASNMKVYIETASGNQIFTGNGNWSIPWNGTAINSISLINQSGSGTVGIKSLVRSQASTPALEAEINADPEVVQLQAVVATEQAKLTPLQAQEQQVGAAKADLERVRSELAGQLISTVAEATASAPAMSEVTPVFQVLPAGNGFVNLNFGYLPAGLTVRVMRGGSNPGELTRFTSISGTGQFKFDIRALGYVGDNYIQVIDATGRVHSDTQVTVPATGNAQPFMGASIGNWGTVPTLKYQQTTNSVAALPKIYSYVEVTSYATYINAFRSTTGDKLLPASLTGPRVDIALRLCPTYWSQSQATQLDILHSIDMALSEIHEAIGYFGAWAFQDQLKAKLGMTNALPWTGEITSNAPSARSLGLLPSGQEVRTWVANSFDIIYKDCQSIAGAEAQYIKESYDEQMHTWAAIDARKKELENMSYDQLPPEYRGGGTSLDQWKFLQANGGTAGTATPLANSRSRVTDALLHSQDPRMVAYRQMTGMDTIDEIQSALQGAQVNGAQWQVDGSGGLNQQVRVSVQAARDGLARTAKEDIWNAVVGSYVAPSDSAPVTIRGIVINHKTTIGQIFLSTYDKLYSVRNNPEQRATFAARLERATGIDAYKIYGVAATDNWEQYADRLIALFRQAGYQEAFGAPQASTNPALQATVSYDRASDSESLTYAYALQLQLRTPGINAADISHIRVYVTSGTGQVGEVLSARDARSLRIQINSADIAAALPQSSPIGQILTGNLKVVLWLKNGQTVYDDDNTFAVRYTLNQTSSSNQTTRRPDEPFYQAEKTIFEQLQNPLTGNDWNYLLTSTHHSGDNLYALDLGSANVTGRVVKVATKGKLYFADLSQGLVILRHEANGVTWETKYIHMTNILESLTGVTYHAPKQAQVGGISKEVAAAEMTAAQAAIRALYGTEIDTGIQLGKVGTEGDSTGPHLHFQINLIGSQKAPVNLFKWINSIQNGITAQGNVGGKSLGQLQWNADANALVNSTEKIIMQRMDVVDSTGKVTGSENVAYAWHADPAQRKRVVWKTISNVRKSDGSIGDLNMWIPLDQLNSPTQYWNGTVFIDIPR